MPDRDIHSMLLKKDGLSPPNFIEQKDGPLTRQLSMCPEFYSAAFIFTGIIGNLVTKVEWISEYRQQVALVPRSLGSYPT